MLAFIWAGTEANYPMVQYLAKGEVYWATPKLGSAISVGDRAYIWRHQKGSPIPGGLIAVGHVAEATKHKAEVDKPDLLGEDLWRVPPSPKMDWKTRIVLTDLRPDVPTGMLTRDKLKALIPQLSVLRAPQGTVFRVLPEHHEVIEREWLASR